MSMTSSLLRLPRLARLNLLVAFFNPKNIMAREPDLLGSTQLVLTAFSAAGENVVCTSFLRGPASAMYDEFSIVSGVLRGVRARFDVAGDADGDEEGDDVDDAAAAAAAAAAVRAREGDDDVDEEETMGEQSPVAERPAEEAAARRLDVVALGVALGVASVAMLGAVVDDDAGADEVVVVVVAVAAVAVGVVAVVIVEVVVVVVAAADLLAAVDEAEKGRGPAAEITITGAALAFVVEVVDLMVSDAAAEKNVSLEATIACAPASFKTRPVVYAGAGLVVFTAVRGTVRREPVTVVGVDVRPIFVVVVVVADDEEDEEEEEEAVVVAEDDDEDDRDAAVADDSDEANDNGMANIEVDVDASAVFAVFADANVDDVLSTAETGTPATAA